MSPRGGKRVGAGRPKKLEKPQNLIIRAEEEVLRKPKRRQKLKARPCPSFCARPLPVSLVTGDPGRADPSRPARHEEETMPERSAPYWKRRFATWSRCRRVCSVGGHSDKSPS